MTTTHTNTACSSQVKVRPSHSSRQFPPPTADSQLLKFDAEGVQLAQKDLDIRALRPGVRPTYPWYLTPVSTSSTRSSSIKHECKPLPTSARRRRRKRKRWAVGVGAASATRFRRTTAHAGARAAIMNNRTEEDGRDHHDVYHRGGKFASSGRAFQRAIGSTLFVCFLLRSLASVRKVKVEGRVAAGCMRRDWLA
jgi:hypothetical protein